MSQVVLKRRRRRAEAALQAKQPPPEVQPEIEKPEQGHSFERPVEMSSEMRAAYEEHKKKVGDYKGPHVVHTSKEEDAAIFNRMGKLGKRARKDPERNLDLFPEKEVVAEDLTPGTDQGETLTFRGRPNA